MQSLSVLVWLALVACVINFWWQSDRVKRIALAHILTRFRRDGLQLLDQTLVIRSVKPVRGSGGSLVLRRLYQFDFTSTGEQRYKGEISLHGINIESLQLDAHIIPPSQDSLH